MEWFEIAGLIAPRPVLMLQGENDDIFPVRGARLAGRNVESLYTLLGLAGHARLDVIPGQPHAYSRPFRERMYGWMASSLLGGGSSAPVSEDELKTLPENDSRLQCDPDGSLMARAQSVISLARRRAEAAVAALGPGSGVRRLVTDLTAAPDGGADYLAASSYGKTAVTGGMIEKILFLSEIGQPVPALLWTPSGGGRIPTVIAADETGKEAIAVSGLPEALLNARYALLAVDLRGRGETLGQVTERRDNNFQYVANSVLFGFPLAGRRAFDLKRAVDFVAGRKDLTLDGLAVAGFGDDALPALLAAATDPRIARVAAGGFLSSFVSQVAGIPERPHEELVKLFNMSAVDRGRTNTGRYEFDLGSVIPSVLRAGDVAEIVSMLSPRRVLYCGTRDRGVAEEARLRRVADAAAPGQIRFEPGRTLDAAVLVEWLGAQEAR
jgi:pimeloyl-ACP methyl ester carboxylesterase